MCARHSAGAVKNSWSWSAPFGTRKGVESFTLLHPPCHTSLAPVAVNEHHAAPISHAQVVYLRANEGLSLLWSHTAVLLRARCWRVCDRPLVKKGFRLYGRPQLLPRAATADGPIAGLLI